MAFYAHAVIEDPESDKVWQRGDIVDDADAERLGLELEFGAISEDPYDESADVSPAPDVVEIDGVRYVKEPTDA